MTISFSSERVLSQHSVSHDDKEETHVMQFERVTNLVVGVNKELLFYLPDKMTIGRSFVPMYTILFSIIVGVFSLVQLQCQHGRIR